MEKEIQALEKYIHVIGKGKLSLLLKGEDVLLWKSPFSKVELISFLIKCASFIFPT